MSIQISISKSTLFLFFFLFFFTTTTNSVPITDLLLSTSPDLSDFSSLLTNTAIISDLSSHSSITLLAVPNSYLRSSPPHPSSSLPDILRYHILTEFLTTPLLHQIPISGRQITTLLQSTVNVTYDPVTNKVNFYSPNSNATLVSVFDTSNNKNNSNSNVSILMLNALLEPYDIDLMASETRPPLGLNITKALIDGHDFNVAASMISASGVVSEFETAATGAGITMFVPTDEAFADLPASVRFQSLPAEKKAVVLRFHVLHSYYPLGTLEAIVNPIYPTLATEQNGAGSFTLNLTRVNGSLSIGTGLVQAVVTQTVFDQKPVAIFGVSKVLLPREYFGSDPVEVNAPPFGGGMIAEAPDAASLAPNSNYPPSHLSAAAPGMDVWTNGVNAVVVLRLLGLCCIGLCYVLL